MHGNAIHYKHDYFLRKDFLRANLGVAKKVWRLDLAKKQKQILWIQFYSFKLADCFELNIYNISFSFFASKLNNQLKQKFIFFYVPASRTVPILQESPWDRYPKS